MKRARVLAILAGAASPLAFVASPAGAQSVPEPGPQAGEISTQAGAEESGEAQSGTTEAAEPGAQGDDIIVTAQRRAETLQSVPIAVSAFTGEALERQQIENASDLQLSLPNVTFTKTNFTSSSFTIRGIGDLCTGFSCDTATGIHVNDMPLLSTRLFETEYFDLERLEVLRGPQGTLFGRNATSGVVNFITARPNLNAFGAQASAEYGNFDAVRLTGVINAPITDTIGVRLAGFYLKRDGYTRNLFDDSRIDDREVYGLRGTIRFQPTENTTLDLIGYYFREDDNRSRIQKQLCHRDPTGVLGCLPDDLRNETLNGNATLAATLTSRELFTLVNPGLAPLALSSVYGQDVFFGGIAVPEDLRTVNLDFKPTYFAEELHLMGRLEQQLGEQFSITVTGGYTEAEVDSRTDYNLSIGNSLAGNSGLATLAFISQAPGSPFARARQALIPNGPAGGVCTSETNKNYQGIFGGQVNRCTPGSTDYDRSQSNSRQYSIEAHLDSDFDGPVNFLLGGIYVDQKFEDSNYYVASFGLDYAAGILGGAATGGAAFLASPFFNSEVDLFTIKSYGLFGEAYYEPNDKLKFTAGIRYSNDKKRQRARVPLLEFPVPYGFTGDIFTSPLRGIADSDSDTPGVQPYDADPTDADLDNFDEKRVGFDEFTGRLVADYQIGPASLVYASYSRGYKSGGINPPLDPTFQVPTTFVPEIVNAFEIGSKNTFFDGVLRLNLSAFYYEYKDLQLSRIVARTSVNDNTDAEIYGVEAEAVVRAGRDTLLNLSAGYLHTKIKDLQLVDPRDVSGGRSDTVIIKDLGNGSNCAVIPNTAGNALGANTFVTVSNSIISAGTGNPTLLRGTTPIPGTNTTGAFSDCSTLAAIAANPNVLGPGAAVLRGALGVATGPLPYTVSTGVEVDLSGNELPYAPNFKFSAGAQHTFRFDNGMTLVPRADYTYTGSQFARSFNRPIDRIDGFSQVNAQVQLNAAEERWFVRAFVQNLFNDDSITGLHVTDQSSGLFTNVFTLEPRRYGLAAGVKF
jgi:iron complex outermembrane recepter protein